MGVGSRKIQTFLCDACGREKFAEEGASVDGFFLEVLQVRNGQQVGTDNVYACSDSCVEVAVRDSLKRAAMSEEERLTATQELWLKGRSFYTPANGLPILDAADETKIIGTAHEIANYRPNGSTVERPRPQDPLSPDWQPEFKGKPRR